MHAWNGSDKLCASPFVTSPNDKMWQYPERLEQVKTWKDRSSTAVSIFRVMNVRQPDYGMTTVIKCPHVLMSVLRIKTTTSFSGHSSSSNQCGSWKVSADSGFKEPLAAFLYHLSNYIPNTPSQRFCFHGCCIEQLVKHTLWFGTLSRYQDVQAHYDNGHAVLPSAINAMLTSTSSGGLFVRNEPLLWFLIQDLEVGDDYLWYVLHPLVKFCFLLQVPIHHLLHMYTNFIIIIILLSLWL